jgi:tRNA G46 methylase TrmB
MHGNSAAVRSRQVAAHPRLVEVVCRHLGSPWRRAPAASGRAAFARIADALAAAPFVLDAGCGSGASTFALARRHAGRLVLGVDKSAARLLTGERALANGAAPANACLLRCDLVDFWTLAAAAGLRCEAQYLLYPNPWPKPEQLMRRWHAHPVLPALLQLGGTIELRTNWRVYADEFATALHLAGRVEASVDALDEVLPLSPFERKYAESGHRLWRCATETPLA